MEYTQVEPAEPASSVYSYKAVTNIHSLSDELLYETFKLLPYTGKSCVAYRSSSVKAITPRVPIVSRSRLLIELSRAYLSDDDMEELNRLTSRKWDNCAGPPLSLTISVDLIVNYSSPSPNTLGIPRILIGLGKRVRVLDLIKVPPFHLAELQEDCFPALEDLYLSYENSRIPKVEPGFQITVFKNSPLKALFIQRVYLDLAITGRMKIPWNGLREFNELWAPKYTLSDHAPHFVSKCLSHCTNLVKLSVHLCYFDRHIPPENAMDGRPPTPLPHLQDLTIYVYRNSSERGPRVFPYFELYHAFTFPSLKSMTLSAPIDKDFDLIFERYPPLAITKALEKLTLKATGCAENPSLGAQMAREFFGGFPISAPSSSTQTRDFLRDERFPEQVVLPNLRNLVLDYPNIGERLGAVPGRLAVMISELLKYMALQEKFEENPREHLNNLVIRFWEPDLGQDGEDRMFRALSQVCLSNGTNITFDFQDKEMRQALATRRRV
ncbi:hypothetical protein NMY22_g11794 [Coprinellus aureogranulatus]|nr:hypothetical protein NMY22_g11794 [Coprinellus aureogranulatus]